MRSPGTAVCVHTQGHFQPFTNSVWVDFCCVSMATLSKLQKKTIPTPPSIWPPVVLAATQLFRLFSWKWECVICMQEWPLIDTTELKVLYVDNNCALFVHSIEAGKTSYCICTSHVPENNSICRICFSFCLIGYWWTLGSDYSRLHSRADESTYSIKGFLFVRCVWAALWAHLLLFIRVVQMALE